MCVAPSNISGTYLADVINVTHVNRIIPGDWECDFVFTNVFQVHSMYYGNGSFLGEAFRDFLGPSACFPTGTLTFVVLSSILHLFYSFATVIRLFSFTMLGSK